MEPSLVYRKWMMAEISAAEPPVLEMGSHMKSKHNLEYNYTHDESLKEWLWHLKVFIYPCTHFHKTNFFLLSSHTILTLHTTWSVSIAWGNIGLFSMWTMWPVLSTTPSHSTSINGWFTGKKLCFLMSLTPRHWTYSKKGINNFSTIEQTKV